MQHTKAKREELCGLCGLTTSPKSIYLDISPQAKITNKQQEQQNQYGKHSSFIPIQIHLTDS